MASLCDLPEEIVEKIMLLVPADSVVQFKFVNRFFYSLISAFIKDPRFVAKHLLITKNQPFASLFFNSLSREVDRSLITFPLLTIEYDRFISVTEDLSIPLDHSETSRYFTYHCDGLILLVNDVGTMVLCNPALKESMILPQPKNLKIKGPPFNHNGVIEFGLDSVTNDFKCVAIWCNREMNCCEVEVYTLGSDSWREINMPQDIADTIISSELSTRLCWRGFCYWLVEPYGDDEINSILSFDMSNDEFHLIHVRDFNIFFTMDVAEADACSWTKYTYAGIPENSNVKYIFWKNDEILMELEENGQEQLVSYNIRSRKIRDIVCDLDRIRLKYWINFYVKSLISIRKR
ncbi:putative F-box protein At4g10190 [Humulus lupulus]|uniref:putative F-box protein At4g10190 n=1 Tax=Humulus lupulus TaxID=3486 RepID=UPI002B40BBB6|nr:putative F-box protein At4g10190 [Humulus lupulus]